MKRMTRSTHDSYDCLTDSAIEYIYVDQFTSAYFGPALQNASALICATINDPSMAPTQAPTVAPSVAPCMFKKLKTQYFVFGFVQH